MSNLKRWKFPLAFEPVNNQFSIATAGNGRELTQASTNRDRDFPATKSTFTPSVFFSVLENKTAPKISPHIRMRYKNAVCV